MVNVKMGKHQMKNDEESELAKDNHVQSLREAEEVLKCASKWTKESLGFYIQLLKNNFACKAAGIAGNDPNGIENLVWYRKDGWGHGGMAETWREHAENLENEVRELRAKLERIGAEINKE